MPHAFCLIRGEISGCPISPRFWEKWGFNVCRNPPPHQPRDAPHHKQRNQAREPMQSHKLSQIECAITPTRSRLTNRQHRLAIQRHPS